MNVEQAKEKHTKAGYSAYTGPKIQGDRHVVRRGSEGYPLVLESVPQPPACLYAIGNLDALRQGLAVIGARKATPYGIACARHFAGIAAEQGITIVSGGALGCDAEAHKAALAHGGATVAVLGGGCDFVYPKSHLPLFQRIVDAGGVVVSEHDWEYPPMPYSFTQRNRIIAGLAKAVLIVEAGLPSGTFSTADEALAAGRDVLVVPGAITSKASAGSNRLLYQGATPVVDDDTFGDVLFDLFGCLKPQDAGTGDGRVGMDQDPLLAALQAQPMRMAELREAIPVPAGADARTWLSVRLAQLEGEGLIARFPNGRYGCASATPPAVEFRSR